MGILTRFKDIMSANINALLDKAENPGKMIDQCLRNMNADLGKVKAETAAVMAEEMRAKRELDECNAEIERMQSYAIKAVNAGNDGDAKKFLEQKAIYTTKLAELTESYNVAHANATNIKAMHDKLCKDIRELESRKDVIKGKLAVAKTQEHINKLSSNVSSANNSMGSFERYEDMANKKLDQAQAMAELNSTDPENSIRDLTQKYEPSAAAVDDELAALKASLNK